MRIFLRSLCIMLVLTECAGSLCAQDTQPRFEVATVKAAAPDVPGSGSWSLPGIGRFWAKHLSLPYLMVLAYGLDVSQIAGKPGWLDDTYYDIEAKPEEGVKLSRAELKPRLQALLRDRFHLVVHTETREARGFILEIAKGGPHLIPTKGDHFPGWKTNVSAGQMRGINWSMPIFAQFLTNASGFPVVDGTGLRGSYDVAFSYAAESDANSALPTLPAALKEATGLLLKPGRVPVEAVVIDSVDKVPTAN